MHMIYADNAATTRMAPEVLEAMLPYLTEEYGNPSTLYRLGRSARRGLEQARKTLAQQLGVSPMEVFFTSGGSEADNWAIKGTAHRLAKTGKQHIITSAIEHPAVLRAAQALEREGFAVTYLPVDSMGQVSPASVQEALREDTALVSLMYANNETGVLQPVEDIAALCHQAGVLFHTDAVQAAGCLPLQGKLENIDLLSLSAHKFYGPKGVGALYCRRGLWPDRLIDGGNQERGRRAGTENVALAVGMARAMELACASQQAESQRLTTLREKLEAGLLTIPGARRNGHPTQRLPGTVNVSFSGMDGQSLLFQLDLAGVAASSGSACNSGSTEPSHVLLAMGLPYELAHGSLRLSLGRYNTESEIPQLVAAVAAAVEQVRGGQT
jgi:cysteine desulfurase